MVNWDNMALAKHRRIGMVTVKCECNNERMSVREHFKCQVEQKIVVRATLSYANMPLGL